MSHILESQSPRSKISPLTKDHILIVFRCIIEAESVLLHPLDVTEFLDVKKMYSDVENQNNDKLWMDL